MIEPEIQKFERNGRNIAVACWHNSDTLPSLFCVHGLTRNSRDFDYIASYLAKDYNIYSIDMVGRGQSDWLPSGEIYSYELYVEDILYVLDALKLNKTHWLGTSMGGIIGMVVASSLPDRIDKMIINDIAGIVNLEAMNRLNEYVAQHMEHDSLEHALGYLKACYGAFGLDTDWQWEFFLKHSVKPIEGARYRLTYDPQILNSIRDENGNMTLEEDINLWPFWDKIPHPTLLLRGEHSDFLSAAMAKEMVERHANATLVEFSGCGHAPALMHDHQCEAIRKWLAT